MPMPRLSAAALTVIEPTRIRFRFAQIMEPQLLAADNLGEVFQARHRPAVTRTRAPTAARLGRA